MSAGFLDAVLARAVPLASDIRLLEFARADGLPLPPHDAGAHVDLLLPLDGRPQVRSYSLLGTGLGAGRYAVAVRRDAHGRGGSRLLHDVLRPGDRVALSAPRGHFPAAAGATGHRLVAGGIGITAIFSLLSAMAAGRAPVSLDYAARSADRLVLADTARALIGAANVRTHAGDRGERLSLARVLAGWRPGLHAYVCGPQAMVLEARAEADRLGWPAAALHCELFGTLDPGRDRPFAVRLARSGGTVAVPAGVRLLDALEAAGIEMLSDCRRGECGLCAAAILAADGPVLHRDVFLGEAERASGARLCTCVSRAEGTLTLAL